MAKINQAIPPRNYEIIRDRIGAILADEIENQYAYTSEELLRNTTVWVERTQPFDKTELPAVEISLGETNYDNKHQGYADGMLTFNIDIYVSAKSNTNTRGDKKASFSAQRLAGVIWYILEAPFYNTLGFADPIIGRSEVEGFGAIDKRTLELFRIRAEDAEYTTATRLIYSVKTSNESIYANTRLLEGFDVNVKLEETNKGWKYSS